MRIGLYYKPNGPAAGWFHSLKQGGEALGHVVSWRNPAPFVVDQTEDFQLVAILGHTPRNDLIIQAYGALGVPVIVMEGAYLYPGAGMVSLGIGRHYWLPDFPCPDDRFKAFGLELKPRQEGGDYILLCGQDNSLWCQKTAKDLRFVTDRKIVFRPHPRKPFEVPKAHEVSTGRPLDEDISGAFLIACETSNVGNLALMAGKPVFCPPRAMFAGLANTDLLSVDNPGFPSDNKRRDYFNRLAYAVWSREELESGTALTFFIGAAKGNPAFANPLVDLGKEPEPIPIEDKVTIITPTGDRPEALALLRQWMANQVRQPDQWLIIDDGKKPVKKRDFPGATVIRRKPRKDDPGHTLGVNLLAALPHIAHDKILIMEDDDWYGPDYIQTMAALLNDHELAGISGSKYYYPAIPGWVEKGKPTHASLSQTALRKSYLPKLEQAIPGDGKLPDFSIDLRLWEKASGSGYLVPGEDLQLHCSIKGLPGRPGQSIGHEKRHFRQDDENLTVFHQWCGDVEAYRGFIKGL